MVSYHEVIRSKVMVQMIPDHNVLNSLEKLINWYWIQGFVMSVENEENKTI